ncbi:MAG TPA: VOC family protein [Anaerolineaceae bacterium]|nr:VOC family protein [Anaerolineaceae bacterium]
MSAGRIDSYLFFNGKAKEAAEYYGNIFGVKPEITLMKDLPGGDRYDPAMVGHATLRFDENTSIMLSDNPLREVKIGDNFSMSWGTDSSDDFDRVWKAFLDNGAKVQTPVVSAFFAEKYGTLTDPFGVLWMLLYSTPEQMNII